MGRLENKVAIITGGNSGIGACAAKLFAKEGAKVVISARRTAQLEEIADEIKKAGGEVLAVSCDISDSEQCKTVVEKAIAQFGTVDILVNNAGIVDNDIKAIEKISDETIDSLININTKGTLYMAREASKIFMEKKSGCIVNVASVAAYATSKAAMIGLTKNIAMRGASIGVRCNALCPGTVVTPMTANMKRENLDPDMMGSMAKHADLSLPPCMPEEVANAILFLASDESSAVTGQIIVIDHGADL